MKTIATTIAAAALVGASLMAAPAQANAGQCFQIEQYRTLDAGPVALTFERQKLTCLGHDATFTHWRLISITL